MRPTPLPGTDLNLSLVGFGCWTIGGLWWGDNIDDSTSVRAIHAALVRGVIWFDTAALYGRGRSDRVLKQALVGRPDVVQLKSRLKAWSCVAPHRICCQSQRTSSTPASVQGPDLP